MSKHNNHYNHNYNNGSVSESVNTSVNEEATKQTVDEENNEVVEGRVEEVSTTYGVVSECSLLRIRKTPVVTPDNTICEIKEGTSVMISLDGSDEDSDFYKVTTESGVEGFCMKKYIKIKEN